MRGVDEIRQPTAGRLLAIWRESGKEAEDPMERALLCNAKILAESCFCQEEPLFSSSEEVLEKLTPREMEVLLTQIAQSGEQMPCMENPAFDPKRFAALRGE